MTEGDWLGCDDPRRLLDALGRASDRKLRLFACACCRHVWGRLTGPSRRLAEAAERYAEGEAPYEELEAAQAAWAKVARHTREARASMDAARVCSYAVADDAWLAAVHACEAVDVADEDCPRGGLLRDVFGNPFRPAAVEPAWLAWNGGTVPKMARAVYEGRRFGDLPVLADALEEAGCADRNLLAHCRAPAPHVRGCWAVDALLGKG